MPKIKFLAFVRSIAGVKDIFIEDESLTIQEALVLICQKFPQLEEILLDDVPDVSFIFGETNLLIPRDLDKKFVKDLTIGPIVAGG